MPSSNVQKVPPGLLSAFDLKTLGVNPQWFSDTLAGVVDVVDHYTLYLRAAQLTNANLQNSGDNIAELVPAGVIWRLRAMAVSAALVVGTTAADGVGLTVTANEVVMATVKHPAPAAVGAVATYRVSRYFDRPLLLQPGSTLRGILDTTLSAAAPSTLALLFEALPI